MYTADAVRTSCMPRITCVSLWAPQGPAMLTVLKWVQALAEQAEVAQLVPTKTVQGLSRERLAWLSVPEVQSLPPPLHRLLLDPHGKRRRLH